MNWRRIVLALMAVAMGASVVLSAGSVPAVGAMAPEFRLASQDGTPVGLADYRGKWVVLYFYPKDGTSGCTIEAHGFQRDQPKYAALNAVVIGVSVDSTGSHKEFCAQEGLTFKLLADTEKKVSAQYGSLHNFVGYKIAKRHTFLVDPTGKIAKVWTDVSPNKHSEEVLGVLGKMK